MEKLPGDPMILLSYINTLLRDYYPSLSELCRTMQVDEIQLKRKLGEYDYEYDGEQNRFL